LKTIFEQKITLLFAKKTIICLYILQKLTYILTIAKTGYHIPDLGKLIMTPSQLTHEKTAQRYSLVCRPSATCLLLQPIAIQ
jgi:hypothetical protein